MAFCRASKHVSTISGGSALKWFRLGNCDDTCVSQSQSAGTRGSSYLVPMNIRMSASETVNQ